MRNLRYPYKPAFWRMLIVALLFGAGGVFMFHEAQTNTRGLILYGLFELDVNNATRFLWGMAVFCALFTVAGVIGMIASFGSAKELVLTETTLTFPGGIFARSPKVVQVAGITRLEQLKQNSQRFLNVHHAGGKIAVTASMLPKGAFEELCAELEARVQRRGQA